MAEREPLRIAYIGAGSFTNAHMYPQLQRHDVRLVAVCDLIEDKARRAAQQYGFEGVYTDFRRMLDAERPAAVICVGGPQVHYEVGREVLALGYPLYVQKSPAPTAALTGELADIAAREGVVCHVGFNIRSSRAVLRAREIIASDEFGPLSLAIIRYGLVSGRTLRDAVMDQHCHAFDTARHLGGEVLEMTVKRGDVPGDRGYVVALKFASGAVGTLNFTSGQIIGKEFFYFEVTGTDGHFITSHDFDLCYRSADGPDEVHGSGNFGGAGLRELEWLGYVGDLASFFDAVRGEAPDCSPVADSIPTMELCEAAYRQLEQQGDQE